MADILTPPEGGDAVSSNGAGGFGFARGWIQVSDDFDAPLEDFKDYM